MDIVVRGASIWPGSGSTTHCGDVRISNGRIVDLSHEVGKLCSGEAYIVEGAGHTLMPGLVEGHGHITFNNFSSYWEMLDMPPEENLLVGLENAKTYLDHGFTSIYSAGTVKLRLEVVLRNAIDAGRWPGPRLRACSPTITTTGGLNDERRLHETRMLTSMIADGPDEMRRTVRLAAREGVDNIKLNMCGDDDGIPTIPGSVTTMVDAEVAAAMEAAIMMGKSICAHTRTSDSIRMALRHGCEVLYHVDLANEEDLDLIESAKDRIFVGPSMGFLHEALQLGADSSFDFDRVSTSLERLVSVTKQLRRRGVRVIIGGDYGTVLTPHGTNARDISHLINYAGYTPAEALECATRIGGEVMRLGDQIGRIKPGYLADFLLVKGNVLEDVSLLDNKDNITMVVKGDLVHKLPDSTQRHALAA